MKDYELNYIECNEHLDQFGLLVKHDIFGNIEITDKVDINRGIPEQACVDKGVFKVPYQLIFRLFNSLRLENMLWTFCIEGAQVIFDGDPDEEA